MGDQSSYSNFYLYLRLTLLSSMRNSDMQRVCPGLRHYSMMNVVRDSCNAEDCSSVNNLSPPTLLSPPSTDFHVSMPSSLANDLTCRECSESFTAISSLIRHSTGPGGVHPTSAYVGPIHKCNGCGAIFKFSQKATKHVHKCPKALAACFMTDDDAITKGYSYGKGQAQIVESSAPQTFAPNETISKPDTIHVASTKLSEIDPTSSSFNSESTNHSKVDPYSEFDGSAVLNDDVVDDSTGTLVPLPGLLSMTTPSACSLPTSMPLMPSSLRSSRRSLTAIPSLSLPPPALAVSSSSLSLRPESTNRGHRRGPTTSTTQTCPHCQHHWPMISEWNYQLHTTACERKMIASKSIKSTAVKHDCRDSPRSDSVNLNQEEQAISLSSVNESSLSARNPSSTLPILSEIQSELAVMEMMHEMTDDVKLKEVSKDTGSTQKSDLWALDSIFVRFEYVSHVLCSAPSAKHDIAQARNANWSINCNNKTNRR